MKVLFLVPYPRDKAPSQRFRVEKLLHLLDHAGISYEMRPFLSDALHARIYKKGSIFRIGAGLAKAYFRRALTVIREAPKYDAIFIHREAAPLGPPMFEWYLAKVLGKKLIYDFDDALWCSDAFPSGRIAMIAKSYWKIRLICKWSERISAGNHYLKRYADTHSIGLTTYVPTVVDTEHTYKEIRQHNSTKPVVGWTGSYSTLKYLDQVVPVIKKLQEEYEFRFMVIADKDPVLDIDDMEFVFWNPQTEISDLMKMDIGLMPLPSDAWTEGKCGFKIIQYLALGIPAIGSDVGVNSRIIEDGKDGYLCRTAKDWEDAMRSLLNDASRRADMGRSGREKIEREFSIRAIQDRFLSLFQPGK